MKKKILILLSLVVFGFGACMKESKKVEQEITAPTVVAPPVVAPVVYTFSDDEVKLFRSFVEKDSLFRPESYKITETKEKLTLEQPSYAYDKLEIKKTSTSTYEIKVTILKEEKVVIATDLGKGLIAVSNEKLIGKTSQVFLDEKLVKAIKSDFDGLTNTSKKFDVVGSYEYAVSYTVPVKLVFKDGTIEDYSSDETTYIRIKKIDGKYTLKIETMRNIIDLNAKGELVLFDLGLTTDYEKTFDKLATLVDVIEKEKMVSTRVNAVGVTEYTEK